MATETQDYGPLLELYLGSYGRLPQGSMMVTLRVCIDETTAHKSRKRGQPMIVTGCVSTPLDWERFDRKWHALLKNHNLSYMNFDDLCNCRGEFKSRGRPQQQQIFQDFGTAAHIHTWFGFNSTLLNEDFERFKGPTKGLGSDLSKILDSDYGVSLRVIYGFLHVWVPKIPGVSDPRLYVIVESGHRNQGAVQTIFEEYKEECIRSNEPQIIKDARLGDKKDFPGLQCADLHGGCVQMMEAKKVEERMGYNPIKEVDGAQAQVLAQDYVVHTPTKVRWFVLPITPLVLTELKNSVILSKQRFIDRFSDHLTPPLSGSYEQPV